MLKNIKKVNFMKTKIVLLILTGIFIASCSKKLEQPDILYEKAINATYEGNFDTATTYLNSIDENYPYTKYAKNAEILLAYVSYKKKDYSNVVGLVDFFIKVNPRDEAVPYLLYIKALTFYDQISGYQKDKQILYEFLAIQDVMSKNYPEILYTKDLNRRLEFVQNTLSVGNIDIAIQYQKQDRCIASVSRYLEVLPSLTGENQEAVKQNIKNCLTELGITDYKL